MKSADEIRRAFLDFFQEKSHKIVPSAPVVPSDDPTLLFTNAGMNQFKDVFLGTGRRDYTRAADSQKCIRISGKHNDLEEVGVDTYHHTFFEMLGNWSFGDYFKAEAIVWAWEFLVDRMGLPADRLYATYFGGNEDIGLGPDEEAAALWTSQTSMPKDRVLPFGMKDNFWEMGETGPCGPCSEIHFDQGPGACDQGHLPGHCCEVNGGCRRFIEIWNLVFIQYNNLGNYDLKQLPARHVDTGMGFERLVAAVQGKTSNYDTDVFTPIFTEMADITGLRYGDDEKVDTAFRVVADHMRALCAAVADGAMPDRKMRGSALRSLLRRAARFGRQTFGMDETFLHRIVPVVADRFRGVFPEIAEREKHIRLVVEEEELSFSRTIDRGLARFVELAEATQEKGAAVIDGAEAFCLFHQDGFPRDLIDQMAREQGLSVDEDGWKQARRAHEEVSRAGGVSGARIDPARIEGLPPTDFRGYWERPGAENAGTSSQARVLSVIDEGALVLDQTPFYAESGGQVGDKGVIEGEGFLFNVTDTARIGDVVIHFGEFSRGGSASVPKTVRAQVSLESRNRTAANHTATHLLHWALKQVLGTGADQQGSLVGPDRLRFDFNHPRGLTPDERTRVETLVNERVRECRSVAIEEDDYKAARAKGVTALFGEKYEERVRVVDIGGFSRELCAGTHVQNMGEIGFFLIVSEDSVAAGVRRIEALTGPAALQYVQGREDLLRGITAILRVPSEEAVGRIEALKEKEKAQGREIESLRRSLADESAPATGEEKEIKGVKVFSFRAPFVDAKSLREIVDRHRQRLGSGVVVVGGAEGGKVSLVVGVSKDLTDTFHAGKLAKELAVHVGGKGGGRPDFAQAGGRNPKGLDQALAAVFDLVAEMG